MSTIEPISEPEAYAMIADMLDEDPQAVAANPELDALEGWDSMGVLMIMAEMDERFGLTVTEKQFSDMSKPSDMIDLLKSHDLIRRP